MRALLPDNSILPIKALAIALVIHLIVFNGIVIQFVTLPVAFKPELTFLGGFLDPHDMRQKSSVSMVALQPWEQPAVVNPSIFTPVFIPLKPLFANEIRNQAKTTFPLIYPSIHPLENEESQDLGVSLELSPYVPLRLDNLK